METFGLVCTKHEYDIYALYFKKLIGQTKFFVRTDEEFPAISMLEIWAKQRNIKGIFCTRVDILKRLIHVGTERGINPSLDNYQGSYFKRNDLEWVFLNPLNHLVEINYAPFVFSRFLSKLLNPSKWCDVPEFNYSLYSESTIQRIFDEFGKAALIAIDIETAPTQAHNTHKIYCVGYTAVFFTGMPTRLTTTTITIPLNDSVALAWIRKLNALPIPKIFQNGKYDCAYLSRYNAVPEQYLFDTATAMHCWYAELPKDLGFIQSFFVRTAAYWKDLAKSGDMADKYLYCGKDTWATALGFCFWLFEAPEWAKRNYLMEFPVVFPSHFCELLGIRVDFAALSKARHIYITQLEKKQASLDKMLGCKFNTASPKQIKALLYILGYRPPKSANFTFSGSEKIRNKVAFAHPLNGRILELVNEIQKDKKLLSTYLWNHDIEDKRKDFHGRVLYALNPHGTDTGRNASRESQFWCGLQIQNIPRGDSVKQIFVADEDFLFGECDLEQAESRDTAFIAGCESLIQAVSGTRDFHSVNASAFFGKPYKEIYSDTERNAIDKPLRDLSKRINHGANYNMGSDVLVETMGLKKVYEAAKLLKLPKSWDAKTIAAHLLAQFHRTYPEIKNVYYPWIIKNVVETGLLVGATGWTRHCFGKPEKNKRDLNAYIAHPPQSLNAMILNKAFVQVFWNIQMHPLHRKNFRLLAQIHDSILFLYRKEHQYLCEEVKKCMEIPVTVKGADGKIRTFTVPAAIKTSQTATHWSSL